MNPRRQTVTEQVQRGKSLSTVSFRCQMWWHLPEVDDAPVVGRVISRLEVVQHALGLCQHKVPLLPLEGLSQRDILPTAVLPYSLLQIPSLQLPYKAHTINLHFLCLRTVRSKIHLLWVADKWQLHSRGAEYVRALVV